jgi:SAM-dependent methyltransferase
VGPASTNSPLDPLDVRALVSEIEREARARRRTGLIDPTFERELDALFESLAPGGAAGDSVQALLDQSERAAAFDLRAPTASNLPGGEVVKRGLQRATGWQFEHTRRQLQAFGFSVVRAVRLLGERVAALERRLPSTDVRLTASLPPAAGDADLSPWFARVREWCGGRPGRVLHAECGVGALVVALRDAGIDAFGADPRDDAAEIADRAGAEVRTADARELLHALPEGELGGIVLSGCVDRYTLGDQLDLVQLAARALAPGGVLVVLATHPDAWARQVDPVRADLSFGRPLHPQTWMHLASGAGLADVETHPGPAGGSLDAGPEVPVGVARAFERLEAVLFPPASVAIVGERPDAAGARPA